MGPADISRFLKGWVRPRYGTSVDRGTFDVFGSGDSGFQIYTWSVMTTAGRKPLAIAVAQTDDGLRVVNGLAAVVVSELSRTPTGRPAGGLEKLRNWATNARRLGPELAGFGFHRLRPAPEMQPMTLEEFARWCDERLARAQVAPPKR